MRESFKGGAVSPEFKDFSGPMRTRYVTVQDLISLSVTKMVKLQYLKINEENLYCNQK